MGGAAKDLVVLVADVNIKAVAEGLLQRPRSLSTREVSFDILVHPDRDPGCLHRSHDLLRPLTNRYAHALVMLDRAGSGQEARPRAELEAQVRQHLSTNGWDDRAEVVVLDPELESWVWSDSPEVDRCLGWEGREPDLRTWLRSEGLWVPGDAKPADPKRAVERALRHVRTPRSSSIYRDLARSVSIRRCHDPAFLAFRQHLQRWFPRTDE